MTRQFHRPARLDPETAESIEGAADTASSSKLAHRTAQALIGGRPSAGGHSGDPDVSPFQKAKYYHSVGKHLFFGQSVLP